jgi:hypothetical protein
MVDASTMRPMINLLWLSAASASRLHRGGAHSQNMKPKHHALTMLDALAEQLGVVPSELRIMLLGWLLPLIVYSVIFHVREALNARSSKQSTGAVKTTPLAKLSSATKISRSTTSGTSSEAWSSDTASPSGSPIVSHDAYPFAAPGEPGSLRGEAPFWLQSAASRVGLDPPSLTSSIGSLRSSSACLSPGLLGERKSSVRALPQAIPKGHRLHSDIDETAAHLMATTHPADPARRILSERMRAFQKAGTSALVARSVLHQMSQSSEASILSAASTASTTHAKRRLNFSRENLAVDNDCHEWVLGLRDNRPPPEGKPAWE